ncbi:hypothetical protein, partial [Brenneria tiliae]|uniref:hypothetical protein n=1 Tax=Brenneria tiliae TaxID=2914984 RepID=UPI002014AC83
ITSCNNEQAFMVFSDLLNLAIYQIVECHECSCLFNICGDSSGRERFSTSQSDDPQGGGQDRPP